VVWQSISATFTTRSAPAAGSKLTYPAATFRAAPAIPTVITRDRETDIRIAENKIHHGPATPSFVELPVLGR